MRRQRVTALGASVVQFFETHLPAQRGMSRHTIRSYRDAVVMLLQFIAARRGCGIESLDLADLDAAVVEDFLRHLEAERHNGIATRNVRLAAIHTLARFLAGRHAERLGTWQAIIALPFKRGAQQRPPEHLAADGVKALLDAIDRNTAGGARDFALLALMFNTGARVQEGKRSGNPSFVGAMKLRTSHLGNQRDEVENGSTADGAVPGACEGVSGIGAEGQGVGRGERRADAFVGELVRALATLAGTA